MAKAPPRNLGLSLDDFPDKGSVFRPDSDGGFRSKMILGHLASAGVGIADDASATLTFTAKEKCALDYLILEATLATTGARLYGCVVTDIKVNTDPLFSSTDTGSGIPISAFHSDNPNKPKFGHKLNNADTVTIVVKNINGAACDIQGGFHVY